MNKLIPLSLLVFFVTGSFVMAFNPVLAEGVAENSWNTKTPMSYARSDLGVVAVEGKIYAIGGRISNAFVGTNEQYDPVSNTWLTLKSMPTPRSNFGIVAYEGKIYCIGGTVDFTIHDNVWWDIAIACDVNEVYDIVTDSWSTKAVTPFTWQYIQAHVVDGNIFVIDGAAGMVGELYMYDPVADQWIQKASLPVSNYGLVSVVVDDKIIVTGGIDTYVNEVRIYDPKTDVWSKGKFGPSIPVSAGGAGATTGCYAPKKIYVIGYWSSDDSVINLVYDPVSDVWSTAKNMPKVRISFGIAVVDDILYVIGGHAITYNGTLGEPSFPEVYSRNEQYIPIGYQSTLLPVTSPSVTPTQSDVSVVEPEPKSYSIYLFVVALVLTVGITIAGLFFYFKKRPT
ncbi:MAG: hypothetical protein LBI79_02935 [Nitrososphaerota archaeon]|jgi:N-acetylneuraminic acid mutarotase|nr:hypothetical protein [Nitrososphaerota archaeon]